MLLWVVTNFSDKNTTTLFGAEVDGASMWSG